MKILTFKGENQYFPDIKTFYVSITHLEADIAEFVNSDRQIIRFMVIERLTGAKVELEIFKNSAQGFWRAFLLNPNCMHYFAETGKQPLETLI